VSRKTFSEGMTIATLLQQGAIIPCGCCRKAITDPKNCRREHIAQLGPKGQWGADTVENCQYWHWIPCGYEKTYGTKATTAGSDVHARKKSRRIAKKKAEKGIWVPPPYDERTGGVVPDYLAAPLSRRTVTPNFKPPKAEKGKKWKR
jgi:hypothetical protein